VDEVKCFSCGRLCDKSKNLFKLSGNINGDVIGVVATVFYSMLHEFN
jgi:hypothetical protein